MMHLSPFLAVYNSDLKTGIIDLLYVEWYGFKVIFRKLHVFT